MDGDGTLQVGQSRGVLLWTSCSETEWKPTRNQIDYIMFTTKWRNSVRRVTTLPGADCGTYHNLLIADVKIKLKRIKRTKLLPKYNQCGKNQR